MTELPIDKIDKRTGRIFNVQRFCTHDGPGIRTTVFFKGCPLSCLWCHNPESRSDAVLLSFQANNCVGCGACVSVCENGVHQMLAVSGDTVHAVDHARCKACGSCLDVCCYDALTLTGKDYTAEALWKEMQPDLQWFGQKGGEIRGGVTLSGGEPMRQFPFVEEFLSYTKNIHVAMETCGFAPTELYRRLGEKVQLYLLDYKLTSPEKHKKYCGTDNALILENLDFLCRSGKNVILRLPVIPGINDDDGHLRAIAELLRKYPQIQRGEVLPYHSFGKSKADACDIDYPLRDLKNMKKAEAQQIVERICAFGAENIILAQ